MAVFQVKGLPACDDGNYLFIYVSWYLQGQENTRKMLS